MLLDLRVVYNKKSYDDATRPCVVVLPGQPTRTTLICHNTRKAGSSVPITRKTELNDGIWSILSRQINTLGQIRTSVGR